MPNKGITAAIVFATTSLCSAVAFASSCEEHGWLQLPPQFGAVGFLVASGILGVLVSWKLGAMDSIRHQLLAFFVAAPLPWVTLRLLAHGLGGQAADPDFSPPLLWEFDAIFVAVLASIVLTCVAVWIPRHVTLRANLIAWAFVLSVVPGYLFLSTPATWGCVEWAPGRQELLDVQF